MTRLVITGMGAITPIGLGVHDYWQNLIAGACGIAPITRFDPTGLPVRIAAEVRDFDPSLHLPRQVAKASSPFMQFAYAAASEAIEQASLKPDAPERIGICMGTAMSGASEMAKGNQEYLQSAKCRVSPHLVPKEIGNMACAHLAINFGFRGPGFTLNTACSAGGDAVMTACLLILSGNADAIVAVGGESILCAPILSSLAQAKALSRRNDEPKKASRPFDRQRDGFVIGEGGGALVIESEEHALKRKAPILAQISGWANTLDGYHITAPDPSGIGAASCMRAAMRCAGMEPGDIGYINAHGTSTLLGDKAETLALKSVFGDNAPPASSTKGATGHLMGAGGLTELIACVKVLETGILPPTLNLETPDPDCDLDYVPNASRKKEVHAAMSNSLGFGGQNSSIIISRYNQ